MMGAGRERKGRISGQRTLNATMKRRPNGGIPKSLAYSSHISAAKIPKRSPKGINWRDDFQC